MHYICYGAEYYAPETLVAVANDSYFEDPFDNEMVRTYPTPAGSYLTHI